MTEYRCLNLGCGKNILPSPWENYDLYPIDDRVKKIDLEQFPYPFSDETAKKIMFSHVLEHLYCNKLKVLRELCRVLRSDGILVVKLPLYGNVVKHTNGFHGRDYLNSVLGNGIYDRTANKLFSCVDFHYNFNKNSDKIIGNIIIRLPFFRRLDFLLYGEGVWHLEKTIGEGME